MRTLNTIIVLGEDGKPLAGAKVETKKRPSGEAAAVYAEETGSTAGANPATTNAHGQVTQWLERGAYLSTVTATGMSTYDIAWDSAPAADGAIDEKWLEAALESAIKRVNAYETGTHAARPSAGGTNAPGFYYETDTHILYQNAAGTWWRLSGPGDLATSALSAAPPGHLACEGQAVSRTTYKALYEAIGVAYGEGDKSSTFNVPDFRERVHVGVGSSMARGSKGGEATHTLAAAELPVVGVSAPYASAAGSVTTGNGIPPHNGALSGNNWSTPLAGAEGHAHNNLQPYVVCSVFIRT